VRSHTHSWFALRDEPPLDEIRRSRCAVVGDGQPSLLAPRLRAAKAVLAHQPLDPAPRRVDAVAAQRLPHAPRPVSAEVLRVQRLDAIN
jgi:hypothetical protein